MIKAPTNAAKICLIFLPIFFTKDTCSGYILQGGYTFSILRFWFWPVFCVCFFLLCVCIFLFQDLINAGKGKIKPEHLTRHGEGRIRKHGSLFVCKHCQYRSVFVYPEIRFASPGWMRSFEHIFAQLRKLIFPARCTV